VEALQVETGERRVIVEGGYAARYLDTGHLLYARGGALMLAPFDARELRLTGPAVQVLKGVRIDPLTPPEWSLSPNGVLVFVPGQVFVPESRLVLADRGGKHEELTDIKESFVEAPVFSPDGDQIAFSAGTEQTDIWTYSLRRRVVTRITYDGTSNAPAWSPDGQKVAFISRKGGGNSILLAAADGNGKPALLSTRTNLVTHLSFQPDGKTIAFSEYDPQTVDDIWLLPVEGQREPRPLMRTPDLEGQPAFAPNGRWLAYTSGSSIARDVYIQAIDGSGRRRVSPDGGSLPVWSRDARELYYMSRRSLTAVAFSPGPDPVPGPPRVVMETSGAGAGLSTSFYDVSPDGRHFVLVQPVASQPPSKAFEVLVNWNPGRQPNR
jgi:dipeptidyl aminopeptidase/acylaminoacyl peptidase